MFRCMSLTALICLTVSINSNSAFVKALSRELSNRMSTSVSASALAATSVRGSSSERGYKIIDSHLHVWADEAESKTYPYADGQTPPLNLQNLASWTQLLNQMVNSGTDGALIVQPINHGFDHSYVAAAIAASPSIFKGMMLHDPSMSPDAAVARLEELLLLGFVGVRFNPYLWDSNDDRPMSERNGGGLAVYRTCGQLNLPVGIMCFKGLDKHYSDIIRLIEASPETTLILDHFGFTNLNEIGDESFKLLLSLSKYPQVHVKISASFRITGSTGDPFPYKLVKTQRFDPLLQKFGADRLLFGTDFPFVLEQEGGYGGITQLVEGWASVLGEKERRALMGGTAERLFGKWGLFRLAKIG